MFLLETQHPDQATGTVAEVYAQFQGRMDVPAPLRLLSASPELLGLHFAQLDRPRRYAAELVQTVDPDLPKNQDTRWTCTRIVEQENGELWLRGFIATPDGQQMVSAELRGSPDQDEVIGRTLAQMLRDQGADAILEKLASCS